MHIIVKLKTIEKVDKQLDVVSRVKRMLSFSTKSARVIHSSYPILLLHRLALLSKVWSNKLEKLRHP